MRHLAPMLCAVAIALGSWASASAQGLPDKGITQQGALVFGDASCPGRLMNAEFALVSEACLSAHDTSGLLVTDSAFYLTDSAEQPIYRFPVIGWKTLIDVAPQTGPMAQIAPIGQGLVVLALDPARRTASDLAALPGAADPDTADAPQVRIVRALETQKEPLGDCDMLAQLSGSDAGMICRLTGIGTPAPAPAALADRPKVNRGLGRTGPMTGVPQVDQIIRQQSGFSRSRSQGARFVRPGGS